jgi:outer membrane protein OmpA-like peptidoglycan-associated protein
VSRAFGAALLALSLAGCATSRVTLLDNEAGHDTGSVAILRPDGSETVLASANSEAALGKGNARVKSVPAARPADTALLASLPPPARSFTIPYETNQSTIGTEQQAVLDQIRAELARRPGAQIEVAAFTDSVGSEADNYQLSLDRARNVASWLRGNGFAIDEGDAVGRGEFEALKAAGDNRDLPEFRRVDVIIR